MTAAVRCFSYAGVVEGKRKSAERSNDSYLFDEEPYLARETVTCTDSAASSTAAALTPAGTDYVVVQVEPGKHIFYEVNVPSRSVTADTNSRTNAGQEEFRIKVSPGTLLSFREYVPES